MSKPNSSMQTMDTDSHMFSNLNENDKDKLRHRNEKLFWKVKQITCFASIEFRTSDK